MDFRGNLSFLKYKKKKEEGDEFFGGVDGVDGTDGKYRMNVSQRQLHGLA